MYQLNVTFLKVHISPHGLDFIKTTLHGFIGDTPLRSDCTCPALPLSLSFYLTQRSQLTVSPHNHGIVRGELRVSHPAVNPPPPGPHFIRGTPGEETWCDADKICFSDLCTADALVSRRGDTMFKSFTFRTSGPALSHGSSPKRNLKSQIGYPSPSSPSLSIKMVGLGSESQTCDTHQI